MSEDLFEAPSLEYLGEHLPQYGFEDFIAQGGMGAVYRARQISLDRMVAIKVLPHELGENEEFRESFSKEAKAMAKVNHPNLISVFDSGDVDGMPYIVMEYIEGSSLHDACHGQVIDPAHAVTIVKGICDGLANAHEQGIIHRDIKPANILLTTKSEPKIGDFGLAHPSDSEELGLVMGTPGYTAPEIFIDPKQAGVLADQYSVGIILHQLISGIDPAGSEGPPTQSTGRIRLDAIWRKATQVNPADRYPSVAAMGAELQKWMDTKPGSLATAEPLPVGSSTFTPTPLAPKKTGGGLLVKLIILGFLGIGGWFGFQHLQGNSDSKPPQQAGLLIPESVPITPEAPPKTATSGSKPSGYSKPKAQPRPSQPRPSQPRNPNSDRTASTSETTPAILSPTAHPQPEPIPKPEPKPKPIPQPEPVLSPGDPELHEKAIALILEAGSKRNALLSKNTMAFRRVLDRESATAASSEVNTLQALRKQCDDGWIPEPGNASGLTITVSNALISAYREQQSIASKFTSETTRIRDFYVKMLVDKAAEVTDPELKKRLMAQADRAADLPEWVSHMAPEVSNPIILMSDPSPIQPTAPALAAGDFVGIWDAISHIERQWEARADGSIIIVNRPRTMPGTWEILNDGSLKIIFGKKDPIILKPDGDAWVGENHTGHPTRLTRAK